MMDAQIVGERIAKLRKSYNMTQKQLADELSVTDKAVSKWETGAGLPDITMLPALASALKTSVDDIISYSSNDENKKDSHNHLYSRIKTVRRYVRKPISIVVSVFIITLVASVIIFNNFNANEGIEYEEGIQVLPGTASGFGITYDQAKTLYDMDLAEIIRTQILQSLFIESANVTISRAETSSFRIQENGSETIVSVTLTFPDAYTFSDIDIQTIENLIRNSLPEITVENINIS